MLQRAPSSCFPAPLTMPPAIAYNQKTKQKQKNLKDDRTIFQAYKLCLKNINKLTEVASNI